MTQKTKAGPIRLVPLLSVVDDLEEIGSACGKVLDLCIEKSIKSYINLLPGRVAVVYGLVKKEPSRSLFRKGKPDVVFKRSPVIYRHISWVALDMADLQDVRDSGAATVESFLHGGLESGKDGLYPAPFEYCVIQKYHPNPFNVDRGHRPERLLEGQVYPLSQAINLKDVLVTAEDAQELRLLLGVKTLEDKWGHRDIAPSVYLVYDASQDAYDLDSVRDKIIAKDERGVFSRAIATTAARIIKVDVRDNAERELAIAKISSNETGKDYADPSLSKRMSLLLLATDCWIHDRQCQSDMEERVRPRREAFNREWADPMTTKDRREKLTSEMAAFESAEREALKIDLYMPSGLDAYLRALHFKSSQVEHLTRIITANKTGGRHVTTEKAAAAEVKSRKIRRVKEPSDSNPPTPA